MSSFHNLIIYLALEQGLHSGIKNTKFGNNVFNIISIIDIIIEMVFYFIISYHFPVIIVISTIITNPLLNYIIYELRKLLFEYITN